MTPEWIWLVFIFAFGACVGSFLNVVVYRLPRDKSLVHPPSACPSCDTPIRFYDNIPLVSWIVLRAKCRKCGARISPRYFIVELITALLYLFVYCWFFVWQYRQTGLVGVDSLQLFFASGGWLFYLNVIVLVSAFLAASAIDLELWIIPISICWFVTAIGFFNASAAWYILRPIEEAAVTLFPLVPPKWAAASLGAGIGLVISLVALKLRWIVPSYDLSEDQEADIPPEDRAAYTGETEPEYDDRREIMKECLFLLPVLTGGLLALLILNNESAAAKWAGIYENPVIRGFLSSFCGYLAGCGVVWTTRILGTLAFGREAMGLGDVHLMGAAGAVIGPAWAVLAFFIAPFFGLLWALYQFFFKKTRQIPYGPFLSFAIFIVIIFQDWIGAYLARIYGT